MTFIHCLWPNEELAWFHALSTNQLEIDYASKSCFRDIRFIFHILSIKSLIRGHHIQKCVNK